MKYTYSKILVLFLVALFSNGIFAQLQNDIANEIDIVVAKDGSGNYTTVQAAIDAVADNNSERTVIFVSNGIYNEKILIPYQKTNITLIGENVDSTVITHGDYPDLLDGNTWGTYTFRADADNFTAINITFENSAGDKGQALAFSSFGDKQLFYHCRFLGWQDTYFINYRCRNYMKDCFIEGAVDYVYGWGIGVYDSCQVHTVRGGGVITATATSKYNRFGLTFRNCRLTTPNSISGFYLGRPWQGHPHVAFLFCEEPASLNAAAWTNMNPDIQGFFAEYQCSGDGFKPDSRSTVPAYTGIQLTEEQAAKYLLDTMFAASSFAKQSEDELEIEEMRKPFDDADLTELIMEVMKGSRDTFPDIPSDDWRPRPDEDILIQAAKNYFAPFLDPVYSQIPTVNSVKVGDEDLPGFSTEIYMYGIELPDTTTTAPKIQMNIENGKVDITYPAQVPGMSTVVLSALDGVNQSTYKIFNSIDSAYWDADLTFLGFNRSDTIDLIPGVYNYDVSVSEDVSRIKNFQLEKSFSGSKYEKTLPDEIPGTGTIVVTAVNTETQKTYTINFSYASSVSNTNHDADIRFFKTAQGTYNLFYNDITAGSITLRLADASGRLIYKQAFKVQHTGQTIPVDLSSIKTGVYFYTIQNGLHFYTGKFILD